ncbi:MAG: MerR family transcriptional regulator, partial [Gemmatimonadota bacterium]|nr:MerR family transcriptional regulator [Gemmatimonadota bacterium]
RSGLPKTTIHHYIREDLLPPARKTAPNAALYDEAHVERLELITRLRAGEGVELSIPQVRQIIRYIEEGFEEAAAVRLLREEIRPASVGGARPSPDFVTRLARADLVSSAEPEELTAGDLLVTTACRAICSERDIEPSDLAPLADLIREVGHYSSTLVSVDDVRRGAADGESGLRDDLARLCDALLWRAFHA